MKIFSGNLVIITFLSGQRLSIAGAVFGVTARNPHA